MIQTSHSNFIVIFALKYRNYVPVVYAQHHIPSVSCLLIFDTKLHALKSAQA